MLNFVNIIVIKDIDPVFCKYIRSKKFTTAATDIRSSATADADIKTLFLQNSFLFCEFMLWTIIISYFTEFRQNFHGIHVLITVEFFHAKFSHRISLILSFFNPQNFIPSK